MKRETYKIIGFYDTETTNIGTGADTIAYPVLYIFNILKNDIECYQGEADDSIFYMRDYNEVISFLETICNYNLERGYVGVIGVYNLLFDMQPIIFELCKYYRLETLSKNGTSPYFIDLYKCGKKVLRFWDMFFLDMRGVDALGKACGLPKLTGQWDYSLIRTNETTLTDLELQYAARDVQVLPKYLKWLLTNNKDITADQLGYTVLTKTGLVRANAKKNIGSLKHGKRTLAQIFRMLCIANQPPDYTTYNLRVKCNRGGWTFTAGNCAFKVYSNVTSLDVTSMHHAFINGSLMPYNFKRVELWEYYYNKVINTDVENVVENYKNPFTCGFNACFIFENIRLKPGSVFERDCIATLAESRFVTRKEITDKIQDECIKGSFSFSKLLKADKAKVCVTEYELWIMNQVYIWDSVECVYIEATETMNKPPEYITLQSNMLFNQKNVCKDLLHGREVLADLSFIPENYIDQIHDGSLDIDDFNLYYVNTIKGMFNGIYGTQVMNPCKPEYAIKDGNIVVKEETKVNEVTYKYLDIDWSKILYTYGMRIVGRSRMHLILGIIYLTSHFGDRIKILAGDTDSLKIACNDNVTDEEILSALDPLHIAITNAINEVQKSNRELYPDIASTLDNIGLFDIETPEHERYVKHFELWNKARLSVDTAGDLHLTFAGLPNNKRNKYRIENVLTKVYEQKGIFAVMQCLGFNVDIDYTISNTLEHKISDASTKMDAVITDYTGNTSKVTQYQSIALYPVNRSLGCTAALVNAENYNYLKSLGRKIELRNRTLYIDKNANRAVLALCDGTELFSVEL